MPEPACPICGAPMYGWMVLPAAGEGPSIGAPFDRSAGAERVVVRCESCGVALERDREIDLAAEWAALTAASREQAVRAPNRASLQAAIGVEGWAAIDAAPGGLLLTPRSLALLGERNGARIGPVRTPPTGRAQASMWQTLLNGLTFHPNFARDVHSGRLRASTARSRWQFVVDAAVTVLAAPLVLLVSAPLELAAAVLRRGGEMVAPLGSA
jgi:hypothetical protein